MKELSIEEKAQVYNKAIKLIKYNLDALNEISETGTVSVNIQSIKNYFYRAFPELKESEDDGISKKLLALIEDIDDKTLNQYKLYKTELRVWLEKQGEYKSVNKVEPKFKVGDWIINRTNVVMQIVNNKDFYESVEIGGQRRTDTYSYIESDFRLWSIQDVKNGDVLCYKDEISLYKYIIINYTKPEKTFNGFVYYCCYDGKRFITDDFYSLTEEDKIDIHPATKEQRDLLFQKMKEAGYDWNSDKKELKKSIIPIFNIGDNITKKYNSDINYFGSFKITDIRDGKYWYNNFIICDIAKQDEWKIYEPTIQMYLAKNMDNY